MSRTITLQPAMIGDRMPYPFHVDADGKIGRQDFWRGEPLAVIGITDVAAPEHMTATWPEVVDDIEHVLGMHLVVTGAAGQWSTMGTPIESIIERDGDSVEHFTRGEPVGG